MVPPQGTGRNSERPLTAGSSHRPRHRVLDLSASVCPSCDRLFQPLLHNQTHSCSRPDSYLPFCPLPGLVCSLVREQTGNRWWCPSEWHCEDLCPPLPSLAAASQEEAGWRQEQSLACGGCFPALLGWAGRGLGRGMGSPAFEPRIW